MASLIVRNIEQSIVDALKQRAAKNGCSAEAEHRKLLESMLLKPKRKSFAEVLASMPDAGRDSDFERIQDSGDSENVLD